MSFKKWFENNELFNQGRLYHGTAYKFDAFDLKHAGTRDFGDIGFGIYLTPILRLRSGRKIWQSTCGFSGATQIAKYSRTQQ